MGIYQKVFPEFEEHSFDRIYKDIDKYPTCSTNVLNSCLLLHFKALSLKVFANSKNMKTTIFLDPPHILSHTRTKLDSLITPAKHVTYHLSNRSSELKTAKFSKWLRKFHINLFQFIFINLYLHN